MPNKSTPLASVEIIAARLASEMGFVYIDTELVKEAAGRFLRIFIDKPDGISVDELETYHRAMLPHVEQVDYDYMEVSSPGVDRPLKKAADFERAAGQEVEVRLYKPQDGSKHYTGTLTGLVDGMIQIESDGRALSFEKKQVALVRPLVTFDEDDIPEGLLDADEDADE